MAETKKVFYSWQSDLANATNRGLIRAALEQAVGVDAIADADRELEIDTDTAGVPGAPDVKQVILEKIERAAMFVADVSLINTGRRSRPLTPNPNVMLELGYAIRALGWERIILVFNLATGKVEQLPFDIRSHRPVVYLAKPEDSERAPARKLLAKKLAASISEINAMSSSAGATHADSALGWELEAGPFDAALKRALREGDDVSVRAMLDDIERDVGVLVRTGEDVQADRAAIALTRLACVMASALRFGANWSFDVALASAKRIYDAPISVFGHTDHDVLGYARRLWLELAVRIEAVGGVAIRERRWAAVRALALHLPFERFDFGRRRLTPWLRHAVTESANGGLRVGSGFLALARDVADGDPCLRPGIVAGDDRVLAGIAQFDAVAALVAMANAETTDHAVWFCSFAFANSRRVSDIVGDIVSNPDLRRELFGQEVRPRFVAEAIKEMDRMANQQAMSTWGGFQDPRITRFFTETNSS